MGTGEHTGDGIWASGFSQPEETETRLKRVEVVELWIVLTNAHAFGCDGRWGCLKDNKGQGGFLLLTNSNSLWNPFNLWRMTMVPPKRKQIPSPGSLAPPTIRWKQHLEYLWIVTNIIYVTKGHSWGWDREKGLKSELCHHPKVSPANISLGVITGNSLSLLGNLSLPQMGGRNGKSKGRGATIKRGRG